MEDDPVASMLAKLSDFSKHELTSEEREVFAALLAPGIAWALDSGMDAEIDVLGFVMWTPDLLSVSLRRALDRRPLPE